MYNNQSSTQHQQLQQQFQHNSSHLVSPSNQSQGLHSAVKGNSNNAGSPSHNLSIVTPLQYQSPYSSQNNGGLGTGSAIQSFKTPQHQKTINSKHILANHIINTTSSGTPQMSNIQHYQSQANHNGNSSNNSIAGNSGIYSSQVNQNHITSQLPSHQQQQQPQFYSVLPTRLMAKPSMFGKHGGIPARYEDQEESGIPLTQQGDPLSQNYYSTNVKNSQNQENSNSNSGNVPLPNSTSFLTHKLAQDQKERAQSLVMNQARKKMASIRHSLDVKSSMIQPSFNTLTTPTNGQQAQNESISHKYNQSLNKQSKISQSAIEIIRNNPLSASQRNPIPIQANSTLVKNLNSSSSNNIPAIQPSKISQKPWGAIQAYAANTHNGIARGYNEDRVSIVLDLKKPGTQGNSQVKKVSFFAVFDGHGGSACAEYLRDNLHLFVAQQEGFPNTPEIALKQGFKQAEEEFMKQNQQIIKEKSGSCACVVLIVDDTVYTANVGDSRAIISMNNGQRSDSLTKDHKPSEDFEKKRIIANGGQLYQNNQILHTGGAAQGAASMNIGPVRVLPGRLSVSRTFGDAHAKLEQFGGNPKVVVAVPDITHFKLNENSHDFILIASDGIFDRLSTSETIGYAWQLQHNINSHTQSQDIQNTNINEVCGQAVERVLKAGMIKESLDNLSVVMIAFKNFAKFIDNLTQQNPLTQSMHHQQENRQPAIQKQDFIDRQYLSSRGNQVIQSEQQTYRPAKDLQKFENKSFRFMQASLQPSLQQSINYSERYKKNQQ